MEEAKTYLLAPAGGAPPPQATDPLVGRVFNNRFRIHSLVARGGMGKVYRAVQIPLGRVVALKVLHPTLTPTQRADFHRRFFLEASIAAQLTHPHTVTVFDFGQTNDGIYYLAMEYLEGTCLRQAMQQQRFFSARRALRIVAQIGSALREAHGLGAIHRDLKPANIYLLQRGGDLDFVKVLDFGLVKSVAANDDDARITQPGRFLGSPGYMAPEQIRGRSLDGRCDIYALGVLLYEMLVGRPPFCRRNAFETMAAHVHDRAPSVQRSQPHNPVPPQLEQLVQRCLQKQVSDRYPSMDALLEAVADLLGDVEDDGPAPLALAADSPIALSRPAPRAPTRLGDEEGSGWSVVCSRGLLALQRPSAGATATSAPPGDEPKCLGIGDLPTQMGCTLAMELPDLPRRLPPAAPAPARMRRGRQIGALLALLGLLLLGGELGSPTWGAAAPQILQLDVRSFPAGAEVYLQDDLICAATPCRLSLAASPRDGRRKALVLRVVKPGYVEYITSRRPRAGILQLAVRLDPFVPERTKKADGRAAD
jgi:hypothetical protein